MDPRSFWYIYLPYNMESETIQMPRIRYIQIVLEHNLGPTFMDATDNRNSIWSIWIDRIDWECIQLVYPWTIDKLISQFQWCFHCPIRHIVHNIAGWTINFGCWALKDEDLRQCDVWYIEGSLWVWPCSSCGQVPPGFVEERCKLSIMLDCNQNHLLRCIWIS